MILFNDIASQWKEIEKITLPKLIDLLRTGPYILGSQVEAFEKEFAAYCGSKYAIGISNGTDGLKLALQYALSNKKIDKVILPANGFIADALAPLYFGKKIEFVDCDQYYNIDTNILREKFKKDKGNSTVIIVVHLYGQAANTPEIKKIVPEAFIIEDCSQAHGATINGRKVGTFGDIGVFSLYPTKNLGAMGDAGILITNNENCYKKLLPLRNYGSLDKINYTEMGYNNRLDEIQALILREKLPLIDKWISKKIALAKVYDAHLKNIKAIEIYKKAPYNDGSTYHIYPIKIKKRDQLKLFLDKKQIQTLIHYPTALHKIGLIKTSKSYPKSEKNSQELLSLPMHPYLTEENIKYISDLIKEFIYG